MRYLLAGLLILMTAAVLASAGCQTMAQAPVGSADNYGGDVAEVVVTAQRPARLMPEVVVSASRMPEVVVHASWAPTTVAAGHSNSLVN